MIARSYKGASLLLFNCVVLFLALNGILWASFQLYPRIRSLWRHRPATKSMPPAPGEPADNGRRTDHQIRFVDLRAYDGVDPAEVETVLDDFAALASQGFVYEPWVEFGEPEFAGRLVHVDLDARGFRHRRTVSSRSGGLSGDAEPLQVFVFGGSTTFGYNAADAWTWPSYLEEELNRQAAADHQGPRFRVTNWGRGFFYSSQEVLLFMTLLRKGYRPDAAFFLDGLNDMGTLQRGPDVPYFTPKTAELWRRDQFGSSPHPLADHFGWLPVSKLASLLRRRLGTPPMPVKPSGLPPRAPGVEGLVDTVLDNYQANLRIARTLCREFGVRCVFVWQPVPYYDYDRSLHRTFPDYGETEKAFELCWERVQRIPEPPVFLGHLPREYGPARRVFVDDFHYSPAFSRALAQRVAAAAGPIWRQGKAQVHERVDESRSIQDRPAVR